MKTPSRPRSLVLDANVLIDYALSEPSVLGLAARHLGPVLVPFPVLEEVDQLSEEDCTGLGLTVVEPTADEMLAAAAAGGRLSFQDHLCFLLARKDGATCVTNDSRLRRECTGSGIEVLWGLEVMADLVETHALETEFALATARAIHEANPRHITNGILNRFEARLRSLGKPRRAT